VTGESLISKMPTDSLYKFMTIIGMVFLLIPFFVVPSYNQVLKNYDDIDTRIKINTSEYEYANSQVLDLEKELINAQSTFDAARNRMSSTELGRSREMTSFTNDLQRAAARLLEFKQRQHDLDLNQIREDADLKELKYDAEFVDKLSILSLLLSGIGAFLIISGLYLWYTRLQKHIDAEMARIARRKSFWLSIRPNRPKQNRRLTKFST